jgi:hypothetical protein
MPVRFSSIFVLLCVGSDLSKESYRLSVRSTTPDKFSWEQDRGPNKKVRRNNFHYYHVLVEAKKQNDGQPEDNFACNHAR